MKSGTKVIKKYSALLLAVVAVSLSSITWAANDDQSDIDKRIEKAADVLKRSWRPRTRRFPIK